MPESGPQLEHIANEIERYLSKHPEAAEDLYGVARWWLTRQRFEDSLDQVQKALDYLLKNGRVVKIVNPDGKSIYKKRGS